MNLFLNLHYMNMGDLPTPTEVEVEMEVCYEPND